MNRFSAIAVLVAVAGCGSKGTARSLLPVDITAAADVGTILEVEVFVRQGMDDGAGQRFPWNPTPGQPLQVGIYMPDYVDGAVRVHADAFDVNGALIGRSPVQPGSIKAGQKSFLVKLHIEKVTAIPDGGTGPDGGTDAGPSPDGAPPADMAVNPEVADASVEAGPPDVATGLAWSPAENLEKDNISRSFQARAAIDGKGNAIVAWSESTSLKTRRYDAATKAWGDIKTVSSGGQVNSVTLGMGANGHATLAWNYYPDSNKPLEAGPRVSHSKDGGNSWSPEKLLHNGLMYVGGALAVSRDGHARLAWEETDQAADLRTLWSARYDDTTGVWSDVAMVKLGTDRYDRVPRIAMDAMGGGLLVWLQPEAGEDSTFGSAFGPNQPLKAPQLLDTYTTDDTQAPAVAVSSDGSRGMAIWVQRSGGGYDLFTAEHTPAGGWKAPEKLMTAPSWVGDPALTIDQNATTTAVWSQPIASGRANLLSARRPAGQPWGPVTALESANMAGGFTDETPVAVMGLDSAGNVHVAWARKLNPDRMEHSFSIVTRRFSGGMWQPEQTLAMKVPLRASDPQLGVAEDGRAVIGFSYYHPMGSTDPDAYNAFGVLYK